MKKIMYFICVLFLFMSCTTYKVFYVIEFEDDIYEYMFRKSDEYIGIMTDSLYYQEGDKLKLTDIEKLKKK